MRQQAGIPARMVVTDQFGAAADLTGKQYAHVMGVYNAFQHRVKTSIVQVHSERVSLPGGGHVEMRHSFGTNTVRVMVMLSKQGPEKVLVLRLSGIGIQTLDADGAILRVLLQPQGTFGKSTGKWTEKRVEQLHGGNQVWQSSINPNDYGIVSGDSVMRNNADAGKINISAKVVFSARTGDGKKFVVAIRNIDTSSGMQVVFYKGTESLSKLKGDSVQTLVQTAQMTLPKWNVIEVHPDGTRFLAWRLARHESASGRVYATYADKMAWFTIGDGTVTEAEDVGIGAGFTVHHADPALPYGGDAPGQVIPTMGSFSYEIVTGAHIGRNGEAVVHKTNKYISSIVGPGHYENESINEKTTITKGDSFSIIASESNAAASTSANYYGDENSGGITRNDTFNIIKKYIDIIFSCDNKAVYIICESTVTASSANTTNRIYDYYHNITTGHGSFSISRSDVVKVMKNGNSIMQYDLISGPAISFSESSGYTDESNIESNIPPSAEWLKYSGMFSSALYAANAVNEFTPSRGDVGVVASAIDPLTSAIILQISVNEAYHWLVIDDTGVRDISAVSKLIPATERAHLILSV